MPYKDPIKNAESKHNWYIKNRERYLKEAKEWKRNHRTRYNELLRLWTKDNLERSKQIKLKSYLKNKEKYRISSRIRENKRRSTPEGRIREAFSQSFRKALKDKKAGRKWETFVDYALPELLIHLEKQFDDKMNWDNYGSYWWIDHIKPMSLFNFENPVHIKECWDLKNLQPMEAKENIRKSNKYPISIIQ